MESRGGLLIGSESTEHLLIVPTQREFPNASDYWDGNWLQAPVRIRVGGFHGEYEAMIRAEELRSFRASLAGLYEALSGSATFETMEDWIRVHVEGDGKAHFTASCEARDLAGVGNTLPFDQTDLPRMLRGLDDAIAAFPVRGSPTDP